MTLVRYKTEWIDAQMLKCMLKIDDEIVFKKMKGAEEESRTWIMVTSLAPSPMASVTLRGSARFTRSTTSAFCMGDTRQQSTAWHKRANSANFSRTRSPNAYGRHCRSKMHLRINYPVEISAIDSAEWIWLTEMGLHGDNKGVPVQFAMFVAVRYSFGIYVGRWRHFPNFCFCPGLLPSKVFFGWR